MPGIFYDFDAWGPAVWTTMHIFTFKYPDTPTQDDRNRAIKFFELVPFYLPCGVCGLHFVATLKSNPLTDQTLTSRETLSRWLVDVHNAVNRRLRKPELSYTEALNIYVHRGKPRPKYYTQCIITIVVLAACLLLATTTIVALMIYGRRYTMY